MHYFLEIAESIITCGLISGITIPILVGQYKRLESKKLESIRELNERNRIFLDAGLEELRAFHQVTQSSLRSNREKIIVDFDAALNHWFIFATSTRIKNFENLEDFSDQISSRYNAVANQVRAGRLFVPIDLANVMDEVLDISAEIRDFLILEYKISLDSLSLHNNGQSENLDLSELSISELDLLAEKNLKMLDENIRKFNEIMDSRHSYADAAKKLRHTANHRLPKLRKQWEQLSRDLLGANAPLPTVDK